MRAPAFGKCGPGRMKALHQMIRPRLPALCAALVAVTVLSGHSAMAQVPDAHGIYERKCARCHEPHGGPFARRRMLLRDGKLVSAETGSAVATLIVDHGRQTLPESEKVALVALFESALQSGGLYERKCRGCHDRAVTFARAKLTVRDGQLIGRLSRVDVAAFMVNHGRLTLDELPVMLARLRAHLESAGNAKE